jgi:hypothetical protein
MFVKYCKLLLTMYIRCSCYMFRSHMGHHQAVQGTYSTNTHTTKVNDTLKWNTEAAAKNDKMKISYQAN